MSIMSLLTDQDVATNMVLNDKYKEGEEKGIKKGMKKGMITSIVSLIKKGLLSLADGANELHITESEMQSLLLK